MNNDQKNKKMNQELTLSDIESKQGKALVAATGVIYSLYELAGYGLGDLIELAHL